MALALVLTMASCSDDKDTGALILDHSALYFSEGESLTVGFTPENLNLSTLSATNKPKGWDDVKIDTQKKTITITAPAQIKDDMETSGTIRFSVSSTGGVVTSAALFVGIVNKVDLRDKAANSYLLSKNETQYTLPMPLDEGMVPARVSILWQSDVSLIKYLQMEKDANGTPDHISLFIGASSSTDKTFHEGNALIGALDSKGRILKSWHVWVTKYDPEAKDGTIEVNGYTMMTHNMGALASSSKDKESILNSYGLYYQWGNKHPFIGPLYYDCKNGASASMFDEAKKRIFLEPTAATAETGTLDYLMQHPRAFLTTEKKDTDWAAASVQQPLWSASSKSANDPCPKGWRVAPAAAFEGLTIKDNLNATTPEEEEQLATDYRYKFGWTLTADASESFFSAAGRKSYLDSKIQNYYDDSLPTRFGEMQPWVGYYWTADTEGSLSKAFCFWLKLDDVKASGVRNGRPMGRANGMMVRCVRE